MSGRGGAIGTLLLGSDISERKILEGQLAQAQKLESIGQLAAGVAHEINTPIQFVGDNTRFLQGIVTDLSRLLSTYGELRDAAALTFETEVGRGTTFIITLPVDGSASDGDVESEELMGLAS